MKILPEHVTFIESVINTAASLNIDNIIIEPNTVRAIDDDRTVVLFQDNNVPDMPFGSIGLTRISVLRSRIEMAKSQDNFSLDAVVGDGNNHATMIRMRASGLNIDYRCANPDTISAPKQINDVLMHRVELNVEAVNLLKQAMGAMGSTNVNIIGKDGVMFETTDINSDKCSHMFTPEFEKINDDASDEFSFSYPLKPILALFNRNPTGYFEIGEKGILSITINGLNIFVLPQV